MTFGIYWPIGGVLLRRVISGDYSIDMPTVAYSSGGETPTTADAPSGSTLGRGPSASGTPGLLTSPTPTPVELVNYLVAAHFAYSKLYMANER